MDRFASAVKNGSTVFVNSSIVKSIPEYDDVTVVPVDAGNIAIALGNQKVMNLVMVGAIIGYTQLLPAGNVLHTAFKKLGAKRPELNSLNEEAFTRGMLIGESYRKRAVSQH